MKKVFISLVLPLIFFSFAFTVNAHSVAESGTANLLIHIDPDDIAVSGTPTTIHISLQNTEKSFSIEKCNCTFYIEQNEKKIFESPITPSSDQASIYNAQGVPFTWTNAGDYNIGIEGNPVGKNLFTPFTVEVPEKVFPIGTNPIQAEPTHQHGSPRLILTEAALFTLLMGYFLFSHNKPKKI